MFTLLQLEFFVAVAEERHFGEAAARLNMTQPPLSRQIQLLEKDLQVRLFDRGSRQVTLTPAGESLLPSARAILDQCARTKIEIQNIAEGRTGSLSIGYTAVAAQAVLPRVLSQLAEEVPDVQVLLREHKSADQARLLDRGEIDLALLSLPAPLGRSSSRRLFADRLMAVMPATHALSERSSVTLDHIAADGMVMYSPTEARFFHEHVSRVFAAEDVQPLVAQTATQVQALLTFVASGLGIGLAPAAAADWASPALTFRELKLSEGAAALNHIDHHLAWDPTSTNPAVPLAVDALADLEID